MRWTTARVIVLCFALSLVTACAPVVAQHYSNSNIAGSYQRAEQSTSNTEQAAPLQERSGLQPAVSFESIEVISRGYTNTQTIALRESPQANAPVSVRLKLPNMESVEILGATRDYLRVRFLAAHAPPDDKKRESDQVGWVAWGEVVPEASAIVLDAETGEVVSRLPFNDMESGVSATFSPDNLRAVFYNDSYTYEVETEAYTLKRSFKTKFDSSLSFAPSFFYGSTDNTLYAALNPPRYSTRPSKSMLNIVRVSGANEPTPSPEISEWASDFAIAPDGRTGFIIHPANAETNEMLVDVLDLQGMRVNNTLTLSGENLPTAAFRFVTSADGRELYANLFPNREVISVIETSTGGLLREIPIGTLKDYAQSLSQEDVVGNSLLFHVWGEETEAPHSVWLDGGKASKAQPGIDYAVEADGVRLAVNFSGTRLFKLDADNHIREKYWIDRPDARLDPSNAESLGVYQLFASPDGKRIILIIGTIHTC